MFDGRDSIKNKVESDYDIDLFLNNYFFLLTHFFLYLVYYSFSQRILTFGSFLQSNEL